MHCCQYNMNFRKENTRKKKDIPFPLNSKIYKIYLFYNEINNEIKYSKYFRKGLVLDWHYIDTKM